MIATSSKGSAIIFNRVTRAFNCEDTCEAALHVRISASCVLWWRDRLRTTYLNHSHIYHIDIIVQNSMCVPASQAVYPPNKGPVSPLPSVADSSVTGY